jgi:hypothetical protein
VTLLVRTDGGGGGGISGTANSSTVFRISPKLLGWFDPHYTPSPLCLPSPPPIRMPLSHEEKEGEIEKGGEGGGRRDKGG